MKIEKLTLKNFRAFENFECKFDLQMNVLVGLNGFGKTSVLDAIAISYGQFVGGFETSKDRGILNSDIRLVKYNITDDDTEQADIENSNMEHQFPVKVDVTIHDPESYHFPKEWSRSRNTLKGRTTQVKDLKTIAQKLQKSVQNNEDVSLPLLSYYGTGRLWKEKRLTEKKNPAQKMNSRLDGYLDCLDPESTYSAFAQWLRIETIADYEYKIQLIEKSGIQGVLSQNTGTRNKLLKAIRGAVDTVLSPSGWYDIRYSATAQTVVASHQDQGDIPVSFLSDGVRNMIGMIADIAHRAVRLNPQLGENAVKETQGIVLIDEVDMHLHPQWQQLVLQNLSDAFPNLQFIVTTHSPQVLTTVKQSQIRLLPDFTGKAENQDIHSNDENEHVVPQVSEALPPCGETYGKPSHYVLRQTLEVDPRPPLPQVELFKEYMKLINSGLGNDPTAVEMRTELVELLGTETHDDLIYADRILKRREFLDL